MITASRVRDLLRYEPGTGLFFWAVPRKGTNRGMPAGNVNKRGYVIIRIDYQAHQAHRLAWLYVHGCTPPNQIDHANGDTADNRIENLRLATPPTNGSNRKIGRNNTSGFKGVYRRRANNWRAVIGTHGQKIWLGSYPTPEAAARAYDRAAIAHHGEFARLNFPTGEQPT